MKSFVCFLIVSVLCLGGFNSAMAEISGTAEMRYADYERKIDGNKTIDANTFAQQYSVMWEKSGTLNGGRGGDYDLALGAEWSSFDTEINGENFDLDTSKILYRGNLLLAPGGLPFRLNAYSYDLHQSQFLNDTVPALQLGRVNPEITTDIANGQHIVTGVTLFVGIRNGSYLGRYRDVLSQVPRLLLDYREHYVRDREGITPQHYRERDLAFVSLNKKDNWFHYRYTDFKDFEDKSGEEDYVEKTYLLGTIDHQQIRRWINMTNWIQVSADGSYTTTDRIRSVNQPVTKRYDFNLFSKYRRSNWDAANFTSFQRVTEGSRISKYLDAPFFANGEFDRNTAWRFQFIGMRDRDEYIDGRAQRDEDDVYLSTRVDTFRQSRYIMSPKFEIENKTGDQGKGFASRAGLEFYSNSRYNPKYDLFGSYSLARFDGTSTQGNDVDAWEQEAIARVDTNLNALTRVGAEQRLVYSTGTTEKDVTIHIQPYSNDSLEGTLDEFQSTLGNTLRSTSTLRGELNTTWRMNNTLELVFDYIDSDGTTDQQFILRHRLDYDHRALNVRMTNEIIDGNNPYAGETGDVLVSGGRLGTVDTTYENMTSVNYSPGRAWEATGRLNLTWEDGDGGSTTDTDLRQMLTYNHYTVNGMVRKLAMVRQEILYERFVDIDDHVNDGLRFTLLGEYYPTRRTLFGGSFRYENVNSQQDTYLYFLYAGVNFEKLQLRFEYEYGTEENVDEQRWEVNVRKVF